VRSQLDDENTTTPTGHYDPPEVNPTTADRTNEPKEP
jgi:hypothetical protein